MRPRIDAAKLTQYVSLELPGAPQPDGDGGYTEAYAPLLPPQDWAAIEPAPSTEQRVASTAIASATHRVTLRYRPDITNKVRVQFTDYAGRVRRLWVRGVENPEEANELLYLWCEEQLSPYTATPVVQPAAAEGEVR